MTSVMNEKLAKVYIRSLEEKLIKRVKLNTRKLNTEDLIQILYEILPPKPCFNFRLHEAKQIIDRNQQTILNSLSEIQYLKRKVELEDRLTASFIRNMAKQRQKENTINLAKLPSRKQSCSFLNFPNLEMSSRYERSRVDTKSSRIVDSLFEKSPINSIQRAEDEQSYCRYGVCNTSRSKQSILRIRTSEYNQDTQQQQKEKIKALANLRKLQKYVFEKENIQKDKSRKKAWNCGPSPQKKRYKEQNQNLKVIQTNLVTHLTLMQKYRGVPSVEGLVAKQEVLKKKERNLKQLSDFLEKKELSLNKKHSEFLKRQKSHKLL